MWNLILGRIPIKACLLLPLDLELMRLRIRVEVRAGEFCLALDSRTPNCEYQRLRQDWIHTAGVSVLLVDARCLHC